jgi:thiamine kinase-like enzyme
MILSPNISNHLYQVIPHFFRSSPLEITSITFGRLHKTFLLDFGSTKAILQEVNADIFNIDYLTENLLKIHQALANTKVYLAPLIYACDGKPIVKQNSSYWRSFKYLENTECFEKTHSERKIGSAARLFARFVDACSLIDKSTLKETIPNFQDMKGRFSELRIAFANSPEDQRRRCEELYSLIIREEEVAIFDSHQPIRIVHNDTKISNVLFKYETDEAEFVLDLDTCMCGIVAYDFGDYIRNTAVTSEEDEVNFNLIKVEDDFLKAGVIGYLSGFENLKLSSEELLALPKAPAAIAFCLSARFLTDYLNGDIYFNINRENQNLDRALSQYQVGIKLIRSANKISNLIQQHSQGL